MSKKRVYGLNQVPNVTKAQLVKKLKARLEVVEEIGGAVRVKSKLAKENITV